MINVSILKFIIVFFDTRTERFIRENLSFEPGIDKTG